MANVTTFEKDVAGWAREFDNPKGTIGRFLAVEAKSVENVAKALAPKKTGRLAHSIKAGRVTSYVIGLQVEVTADAPYSLAVHEGTPPHIIKPEGEVLVFPSSGGGIIFTDEVSHPGATGKPFLNDALIVVTQQWDGVGGTP